MADRGPPQGNAPQGDAFQCAPPWLCKAQVVSFGSRYSFPPPPIPENPDVFSDGQVAWLPDSLGDTQPLAKVQYVLDLLQHTQTTGLNVSALQILSNALVDALPREVQDRIGLHMNLIPAPSDTGAMIEQPDPDWFSQEEVDFRITVDAFRQGSVHPLSSDNREFILWVVEAGTPGHPHYVTIVLHYGASDPLDPQKLDRITHWGIVDPLSTQRIYDALVKTERRARQLLQTHGIADARQYPIWVPPFREGEDFAAGFVAYSAVAQLLERIGIMHCAQQDFNPDTFFAPTRPRFNPDALCAEALGRVAMVAMEKLEWRTRLGLFPIQLLNDGQGEKVDMRESAPDQKPPIAHGLGYRRNLRNGPPNSTSSRLEGPPCRRTRTRRSPTPPKGAQVAVAPNPEGQFVCRDFEIAEEERRTIHIEADRILSKAHAARRDRDDANQLAEIVGEETGGDDILRMEREPEPHSEGHGRAELNRDSDTSATDAHGGPAHVNRKWRVEYPNQAAKRRRSKRK